MNAGQYILMIEDNPDDAQLTLMAFARSRLPIRLVVVPNGEEALDFLWGQGKYAGRDVNDKPTVILLDLKLPLMSGQEVLKEIRQDYRISHIPVVVVSSTANMQQLEECENFSFDRYFRKPSTSAQFRKIITEIRRSWLS